MFILVRTDPSAKKQQGITFLLFDLADARRDDPADPPHQRRVPVHRDVPRQRPGPEGERRERPEPRMDGREGAPRPRARDDRRRLRQRSRIDASGPRRRGRAALRRQRGRRRDRSDLARSHRSAAHGSNVLRADGEAHARTEPRSGAAPAPSRASSRSTRTELNQRRQELLCSLRGPQSVGWEGAGFDREELTQTRDWLRSRGNTIEGGTSEIQLNIIAKGVLGLPD